MNRKLKLYYVSALIGLTVYTVPHNIFSMNNEKKEETPRYGLRAWPLQPKAITITNSTQTSLNVVYTAVGRAHFEGTHRKRTLGSTINPGTQSIYVVPDKTGICIVAFKLAEQVHKIVSVPHTANSINCTIKNEKLVTTVS